MYKTASRIKHRRDTKPLKQHRRPQHDYKNAIYIGNLPDNCRDKLRKLLVPYGLRKGPYVVKRPIDELRVKPHLFAFANMRSADAVRLVIEKLDWSIFNGRRIRVKVARKPLKKL